MTHLFLFTIGPVQSFIAQARKTRDLFAGSRILSDLIESGISEFETAGGKVIFPHGSSPSKPNRFLGYLDDEQLDTDELKEIGKGVEKAVKLKWQEMADDALGKLSKPNGFDDQITQALETFWVFHPAKETDYHTAYRDIERTLGAIKNARPIHQYHYQEENDAIAYGEKGRKCSLDGERNVKFYRPSDKEWENLSKTRRWKLFNEEEEEVRLIADKDGIGMKVIAPGEGLSAVSFVKRQNEGEDFAPTAFFAASEFIYAVENTDHPKAEELRFKLSGFTKIFGRDWDEQLLFEENYNNPYFKFQGLNRFSEPANLLEELKEIFRITKEVNIEKPNGYYALFLFDGDNMGKWLSGANLEDGHNKGEALFDFHQNLARLLAEFANGKNGQVKDEGINQYLQHPKGRTIYAGGDDFLGFINLDRVFEVLEWTREQFDLKINQQIEHRKENFTFSGGLVIAHYKTPLHVVLDWARATEKAAKKYIHPHGQRKDTLGISVLKASGEITQAFVPWQLEEYDKAGEKIVSIPYWSTEAMKKVVESLRKDFSDKWLRNLDAEFHLMKDRKDGALELQAIASGKKMIQAEMRRLLKRARLKAEDAEVEELLPYLHSLLGEKPTENFGNFSRLLHICDFIERHTNGLKEAKSSNLKEPAHG
jgi:CRISPR-associated protein Cmr2